LPRRVGVGETNSEGVSGFAPSGENLKEEKDILREVESVTKTLRDKTKAAIS
jgi:hypothetical protein